MREDLSIGIFFKCLALISLYLLQAPTAETFDYLSGIPKPLYVPLLHHQEINRTRNFKRKNNKKKKKNKMRKKNRNSVSNSYSFTDSLFLHSQQQNTNRIQISFFVLVIFLSPN